MQSQPSPVEEKEEEYSDYSYSDYSEDEDAKRRELIIKRAAKRNTSQSEGKLLSKVFESSKKLINEISNTVSFEASEARPVTV